MSIENPIDWMRYQRQVNLPQIGREGQQKLQHARILCVGVGGLGAPCSLYLAAAGIGHLGLIDDDVVEQSNLHRQIIFKDADVGQSKVACAAQHLHALNPNCDIQTYPTRLNAQNCLEIITNYDIIIDGSDNFATRYLTNDACIHLNKPLIQASVQQFQGQCLVVLPQGPCYRCLFPEPPHTAVDCNSAGVIGMLPGLLGNIQALEAIKYSVGLPSALTQHLLTVDTLDWQWRTLKRQADPQCPACQQRQAFADIQQPMQQNDKQAKEIELDPSELNTYLQQHPDCLIVDVRTQEEYALFHLPHSVNIPLATFEQHTADLSQQIPIIVTCAHGVRSQIAVQLLFAAGFNRVKNLRGGLARVNACDASE